MGIETGVDVFKLMDVAEDLVVPMMDHADPRRPRLAHPGLRGRVLRRSCCSPSAPARSTACPARDILVELGRRSIVGGQEDMIEDTAITLARTRTSSHAAAQETHA